MADPMPALTTLINTLLCDYADARESVIDESCSGKGCEQEYTALRKEIAAYRAQWLTLTGQALDPVSLRWDTAHEQRTV